VASWQIVVGLFFVLLPLMLMIDFWGDERLTARGRPVKRAWFRQGERAPEPAHPETAADAHEVDTAH